jgi:hypothetical protein
VPLGLVGLHRSARAAFIFSRRASYYTVLMYPGTPYPYCRTAMQWASEGEGGNVDMPPILSSSYYLLSSISISIHQ